MTRTAPDVTAAIDTTEADLSTLVEGLRTDGVITDDDASEFQHRVETIGAELRACVEYAETGPLSEGGDDY